MKKVDIAPSILNAPFDNLQKLVEDLYKNGATYLHFDVMDGHFVPNLSFGSEVLKSINKEHKLINDVHLMVDDPLKYVDQFLKAKADIITIHYEAFTSLEDLKKCIDYIKSKNLKAGVSIKPNTSEEVLFPIIKDIDLILVMSVEPGFGGQAFQTKILKKIEVLDTFRKNKGLSYKIEVDGGINNLTINEVVKSGADIVVVGSYLFKQDLETAFKTLRESIL